METKQVGSRGILFSFDEIGGTTNVYVINGRRHTFIIDTFIGPESMQQVNSYIEKKIGKKPIIIVNTHYHWDHVWGNCIYKDYPIIAHRKCLELLAIKGEADLEKYGKHAKGKVEITLPNLTFVEELRFVDDGVRLFYSPGHTEDCITIYDESDKVLFVGDNLERPIPYLSGKSPDAHLKTLEDYLKMDFDIVIGGHTGIEGKQLIHDNAAYIRSFFEGCVTELEDEEYKYIHELNIKKSME